MNEEELKAHVRSEIRKRNALYFDLAVITTGLIFFLVWLLGP